MAQWNKKVEKVDPAFRLSSSDLSAIWRDIKEHPKTGTFDGWLRRLRSHPTIKNTYAHAKDIGVKLPPKPGLPIKRAKKKNPAGLSKEQALLAGAAVGLFLRYK